MVDLSRLAELRGISVDGDAVVIGALSTYAEIRRSSVCREHLPALVEAAATVGAAQIQNRGTLGGNAANASPAGDTLPVLLAMDASFVVGAARGERTIPSTDFWVAYRRTALAPDELIVRIRIPLGGGRETRFRKIGTRRAQAISKVVLALAWRDEDGQAPGSGMADPDPSAEGASTSTMTTPRTTGAWHGVRLALGSVADRPIRALATEAVLEGAAPTPETADAAAEALAAEIHPIDDVRSTGDYRRVVAARALHRMIRDAGGW
jgi:CO/xanthine dehydrogenase FAD-binding subunit